MMTKKRKIKSTLSSEPKPQFLRWVVAALGLVIAVGFAGTAEAQVPVYPTGDPVQDVSNVQNAVNAGGTVLLKATDATGNPQYFNFEAGIVEINNDVVIVGEAGSITLPDGRPADRSAIYGGGGTGFPGYGDNLPINRAGAFTVVGGSFEISGLRLDSSSFASIFVRGCGGARISDNVITYTRPVQDGWRSWAKPICFAEWTSYDNIFGEIIIEGNEITLNPNPPYQVWWPEGISVIRIKSTPMPDISIIGNTIEHPSEAAGKYPKGINSWHPALIKDNTITGYWHNAIRSESSITGWYPHQLGGSVIEGNTIEGLGAETPPRGIVNGWANGTVIRNNTVSVSGNTELGIESWKAANTEITGNTIEIQNPTSWGAAIRVGGSNGCTVTDNMISGNAIYALLLDNSSGNNQIVRNDLRGFSVGSFVNPAYDWACDSGGTNFTDPTMTLVPGMFGNALSFSELYW